MKTSNGLKVPTLRIETAAKALAPFLQCRKNCDTCPFYQHNDDNPDIPWNCALLNARDALWEVLFCAWEDEIKRKGGRT
jgi:hypothetical protein